MQDRRARADLDLFRPLLALASPCAAICEGRSAAGPRRRDARLTGLRLLAKRRRPQEKADAVPGRDRVTKGQCARGVPGAQGRRAQHAPDAAQAAPPGRPNEPVAPVTKAGLRKAEDTAGPASQAPPKPGARLGAAGVLRRLVALPTSTSWWLLSTAVFTSLEVRQVGGARPREGGEGTGRQFSELRLTGTSDPILAGPERASL